MIEQVDAVSQFALQAELFQHILGKATLCPGLIDFLGGQAIFLFERGPLANHEGILRVSGPVGGERLQIANRRGQVANPGGAEALDPLQVFSPNLGNVVQAGIAKALHRGVADAGIVLQQVDRHRLKNPVLEAVGQLGPGSGPIGFNR